MTLYLLRHAPTEANRQGVILGASDPPAAPGELVVFESLAGVLSGKGIVVVYSSPLSRAVTPARRLAQTLGASLEILPGLAELSAGEYEGRPRLEILPRGCPLRRDWTDRPPGGESMADSLQRVTDALGRIQNVPGESSAVLVGHAVVNRVILKILLGIPEEEVIGFVHPFGTVLVVEPSGRLSWFRPEGPTGHGLPGPGEGA